VVEIREAEMTEPTARPYEAVGDGGAIVARINGHRIIIADVLVTGVPVDERDGGVVLPAHENRALFIRACNSYDADQELIRELVGACKNNKDGIIGCHGVNVWRSDYADMEAALVKAKEAGKGK